MQAKAWASYQIAGIAKDVANTIVKDYVDANVNIKYNLAATYSEWILGDISVKEYSNYISVSNTKRLLFNNDLRFNGNIFDNAGVAGSIKKIYCHPITIFNATTGLTMSCMIFNNSNVAYTASTFIAELKTWNGRLIANGIYKDSSSNITHIEWVQYYNNKLLLRGSLNNVPAGYAESPDLEVVIGTEEAGLYFTDSVNAIN